LSVTLTSEEIYTQSGVGIEFYEFILFIDVSDGLVMGQFDTLFPIYLQFGSRVTSSTFRFVEMLSFFLFISFNAHTLEALRCVPSDVRRSALENAKHDVSIVSETRGDNSEVDNDMESEIQLHSKFFKLAVKDEL
jgi:hypothetical protein